MFIFGCERRIVYAEVLDLRLGLVGLVLVLVVAAACQPLV